MYRKGICPLNLYWLYSVGKCIALGWDIGLPAVTKVRESSSKRICDDYTYHCRIIPHDIAVARVGN